MRVVRSGWIWNARDGVSGFDYADHAAAGAADSFFRHAVRPRRRIRDFRRGVVSDVVATTPVYFISRAAISSSRWSIALHAAIASNGFIILATSVW